MHNRHLAQLLFPLILVLTACGDTNKPDAARTLQIGNFAEPGTLDPTKLDGAWESQISTNLFMGLTTVDAKGNIIPGMATSWTTSPNGLTWTFNLRDAQWSDGTDVTAQDFEYSLKRSMTVLPGSASASVYFVIKNGEAVRSGKLKPDQLGVRAIDNKTLQIELENSTPYLPNLLAYTLAAPVPKHIVEKWGNAWIKPEHIVVNGPYTLSEWKAGDFVRLTKNSKFFEASSVCLNDLYFYPTKDVIAAERAVRSGKLDLNFDFSGSRLEEIKKNMPGFARTAGGQRLTYVTFNMKNKNLSDRRVREALSMAIDRDFIAPKVLADGSEPAFSIVPPGVKSYPGGKITLDFKGESQPQRIAKARMLLEAAGYGPKKPLVLVFAHRNSGDVPKVAPVLQQNWQSIAPWVKITLQANDTAIHYNNLVQGAFDFADSSWGTITRDGLEFLTLVETQSGMNDGKFSDPIYDALLAKATQTVDETRRTQILEQAEARALTEYAITPVYFDSIRSLVNPRITGYELNSNGGTPIRYLCTKEALAAK